MACESMLGPKQTLEQRMAEIKAALARLERQLQAKLVKLSIASNGAVSFVGWKDRDGLSDACTYRSLSASNSWELRQAVARAEAETGRKVNPSAVAQGWHSHNEGKTFEKH